ncbi:MAG: hypothetical protein ACI8R1_002256, partial [Psychrobacter glaciei]
SLVPPSPNTPASAAKAAFGSIRLHNKVSKKVATTMTLDNDAFKGKSKLVGLIRRSIDKTDLLIYR